MRHGRVAGLLLGVGGLVMFGVAAAGASPPVPQQVGGLRQLLASTPSDTRATFHDGNVVTCAGAGFPGTTQMGSPANTGAADPNVAGTVATNNGTILPGQGQEVNIALLNSGVVINAVVVKGGDGYNVYPGPTVVPPALSPPQHYISPLNGGGTVPTISHWFVCYQLTTPPPVGSLTVTKTVIAPAATPATPIPTTFAAIVNCNDGVHTNIPVTFGLGGGRAATSTISGIATGTVCTVVEDTGSSPPGSRVRYNPLGANTAGVTIGAATGVIVDIINDFSGLTPQTGNLRMVKTVLPAPPGVTLPASYTAQVVCDDRTDATVTLPGSGGDGTPIVTVADGALCAVGEDIGSLPAGWVVTYSVAGGPASSSPPVFNVAANTEVVVTITNDPSAVAVVTTVPTSTPEPTPEPSAAPTMPSTLPPTGATTNGPLMLGVVLIGVGLLAVGYTVRRRSAR